MVSEQCHLAELTDSLGFSLKAAVEDEIRRKYGEASDED